jgi:hypothetical protein
MGRIVELRWNCGECDSTGILGRHKECPQCGAPREKGEMKMDGLASPGSAVTDPALLELAHAGPDWFCTYCESGNRGDVDVCESCSAPRLGEADEDHPDFARRPPEPPPPLLSPTAKANLGNAKKGCCASCGCLSGGTGLAVLGLLLLVLVAILFAPDPPPPRTVQGQVTSVVWKHEVAQERWSDVTVGHWRDQVTDGQGVAGQALQYQGNCRQEVRGTNRRACGSHEECSPKTRTETYDDTCTRTVEVACGETCTDLGNGFASCETDYCDETERYRCEKTRTVPDGEECETVTDYCEDPYYGTKCDYLTQIWQPIAAESARGTGVDTRWPALDTRPDDRFTYSADYDVTVTYRDGDDTRTLVLDEPVGPDLSGVDLATADAARERLQDWAPGTPVWVSLRGWDEVTGTSLKPPG